MLCLVKIGIIAPSRRDGGTEDAADSKSAVRKDVRVRVPLPVPLHKSEAMNAVPLPQAP
jgi:hypothetical protein